MLMEGMSEELEVYEWLVVVVGDGEYADPAEHLSAEWQAIGSGEAEEAHECSGGHHEGRHADVECSEQIFSEQVHMGLRSTGSIPKALRSTNKKAACGESHAAGLRCRRRRRRISTYLRRRGYARRPSFRLSAFQR
ncbi:MAG: hypothetical protein RL215_3075 [Planctomycetota bacterium]